MESLSDFAIEIWNSGRKGDVEDRGGRKTLTIRSMFSKSGMRFPWDRQIDVHVQPWALSITRDIDSGIQAAAEAQE